MFLIEDEDDKEDDEEDDKEDDKEDDENGVYYQYGILSGIDCRSGSYSEKLKE